MSRIERRYEALQRIHEVWPPHLLHKELHLYLVDNSAFMNSELMTSSSF